MRYFCAWIRSVQHPPCTITSNHHEKQGENASLFRLGDIYITLGAPAALTAHAANPETLLDRHVTEDWSNLSHGDIKANHDAFAGNARVLSSYRMAPIVRIRLITEADHASTTILLPGEY